MEHPNPVQPPVLDVKIDKGTKLINTTDALYVKGNGKYSTVFFTDGKMLETRHLLKWFEEQLPEPIFCRCHDSFIINCAYIHCTNGNQFVLKGDIYVSISRKYKDYAKDMYARYVREHNGH